MRPMAEIEARIAALAAGPGEARAAASELLALGEEVLEHWLATHGRDKLLQGLLMPHLSP